MALNLKPAAKEDICEDCAATDKAWNEGFDAGWKEGLKLDAWKAAFISGFKAAVEDDDEAVS
jgi:hypothetical protein